MHAQPHVRLLRAALRGHLDRLGVNVEADHLRIGVAVRDLPGEQALPTPGVQHRPGRPGRIYGQTAQS